MADAIGGQGWVLRRWRLAAGLTGPGLAHAVGVSKQAVDQWEDGDVPLERHGAIDAAVGGGGTCAAMLWAATTPDALASAARWTTNLAAPEPWAEAEPFTDPAAASPSWVWLRVDAGDVDDDTERLVEVVIRWGPVVLPVRMATTAAGVLATSPVTVGNPGVEVHFGPDSTGWADFGIGTVPHTIGVPQIPAMRNLRLHRRPTASVQVVAAPLRRFAQRAPRTADRLAARAANRDFIVETLGSPDVRSGPMDCRDGPGGAPPPPPDPNRFRVAREGRNLSRAELAALASMIDAVPVSPTHVKRFEAGARPTVPLLEARLDTSLGANGTLSCCRLNSADVAPGPGGERSVTFPTWWVGPVWIQILDNHDSSAVDDVTVRLSWSPWTKLLAARTGQVLSCRKATPRTDPLRVSTRSARGLPLLVVAGVGEHPAAIDVNHEWEPIDGPAERALRNAGLRVYLRAFGFTAYRRVVDQILSTGRRATHSN